MNSLLEKFAEIVNGCISGFDRIVFKGLFTQLAYARGTMNFCGMKGILNKDYKKWMTANTAQVIECAETYAKDNCGQGITPISSWRVRKEALAHERQQSECRMFACKHGFHIISKFA